MATYIDYNAASTAWRAAMKQLATLEADIAVARETIAAKEVAMQRAKADAQEAHAAMWTFARV